jgi:Tol biopolymer transport system component
MIKKYSPLFLFIFAFSLALSSCGGKVISLATSTPIPSLTPLSTTTPLPTPTSIPPSGLITFDSNRDENGWWGIYAMNADGTEKAVLLAISPNGGDVYSAWSPDGQKIAFHSYRNGADAEIYIMNADGTGLKRLTHSSRRDIKPTWSPDGTQIAFLSSENQDGPYELFLMNLNDSSLKRLTDGVLGESAPSWSPDGRQIAFEILVDDRMQIFVINTDGSGLAQLTSISGNGHPSWSPDGQEIAFVSGRDGNNEIYLMNDDGSNAIRLTSSVGMEVEPTWSPDGNYIAFSSDRSGNFDIYVMKADGSDIRQLTNDPADDYTPRWSIPGIKLSEDPWIGPPFCVRDTDGDMEADTVTDTFTTDDWIIYLAFPYRNLKDGMSIDYYWIDNNSSLPGGMDSSIRWKGGESGFYVLSPNIATNMNTAGTRTIRLSIEDRLVQEIECYIVEP